MRGARFEPLRPMAWGRGRQDGCSRVGALAPRQPATPGGGKTPPIVVMGLGSLPPGISPTENEAMGRRRGAKGSEPHGPEGVAAEASGRPPGARCPPTLPNGWPTAGNLFRKCP